MTRATDPTSLVIISFCARRTITVGDRTFAVAASLVRKCLPLHSVHGISLWPARRFGTLYQTAWGIRILAEKKLKTYCTEEFSVLEMFQDDTHYKFTFLLTYLLTRHFSVTPYLYRLSEDEAEAVPVWRSFSSRRVFCSEQPRLCFSA